MKLGYIRPDPRHAEGPQRALLEAAGVSKIWVEKRRKAGDGYSAFEAMCKAIRSGADVVFVSDFHRIAATGDDEKANVRKVRRKGAHIIEVRSMRSTSCTADAIDMAREAAAVRAGKGMSREAASEIGKVGAANSPRSKPKAGRMGERQARAIWKDERLSWSQALAKMNAGRPEDQHWTKATAYRRLKKRH